MQHRRNILIAVVAGIAVAAFVTFYIVGYRQAPAPAAQASAEAPPELIIPTIDEMCAALGAGAGDALKQCQTEQGGAAEYVVAWMALNGFMAGGQIDFAAIQFGSSLETGDPLVSEAAGEIDPITGESTAPPSAASVALLCLGMSPDWVMMQACIAQNDASANFEDALGLTGGDPAAPPAGAQ